jgi:hypothetical protein
VVAAVERKPVADILLVVEIGDEEDSEIEEGGGGKGEGAAEGMLVALNEDHQALSR